MSTVKKGKLQVQAAPRARKQLCSASTSLQVKLGQASELQVQEIAMQSPATAYLVSSQNNQCSLTRATVSLLPHQSHQGFSNQGFSNQGFLSLEYSF